MRIFELTGGLTVPLTNEENDLLLKFELNEELARRSLNEREIVVANNMVNKDVLYRQNKDGRLSYRKK